MIDLPKPGVYVVRAPNAASLSHDLVQKWLDSQEETPFKSCLWLTAGKQGEVRAMLEPYLLKRGQAPKGLDVVSVRNLTAKKSTSNNGIRQLCRSLDTLCVLQPALVIVENAELWFDQGQESLDRLNPMAQMRLLHQWARHAHAHVVTPVQGDLPDWSVFADGLADVNNLGAFEFRPWWPTQWGVQTNLWSDQQSISRIRSHVVLDSKLFDGLKGLAKACHAIRFSNNEPKGIHIQGHGELTAQDSSVLLRMGADSVWLEHQNIATWLGISAQQVEEPEPTDVLGTSDTGNFARDLHEVFMPGQLKVVANPIFSTHGLMLLQLAKRWSVYCSITRFSLMQHMTAKTALRLANWAQATCMFTATREAIYVMRLWEDKPMESTYREWLESCFRENLSVLFSGDIQFIGNETQVGLLNDLYGELEPLSVEDLLDEDVKESVALAELWDETQETLNVDNPWMKRMGQLMSGTRS